MIIMQIYIVFTIYANNSGIFYRKYDNLAIVKTVSLCNLLLQKELRS